MSNKKSKRPDGRGHWPAGKRRSSLTPAAAHAHAKKIRAMAEDLGGYRAVARSLGVSDRTVRRWISGEDYPIS